MKEPIALPYAEALIGGTGIGLREEGDVTGCRHLPTVADQGSSPETRQLCRFGTFSSLGAVCETRNDGKRNRSLPGESAMPLTTLSNLELLAVVVGPREALRLYTGSLSALFAPSGNRSKSRDRIEAVRELIRRWLLEELKGRDVLASPAQVRDCLVLHFAGQEHESFMVLFLDAQHRLIGVEELFRGTLTQTSVYPREIVKGALRHNAAAVIFAHNHPSGVAEPSRADELLTSALKQALALVDVKVLDHFIVAGAATVSLAEKGGM